MIGMPRAAVAICRISSISAHWPNRCTGMIAFVAVDSLYSTSAGSRLNVSGRISANTGFAPSRHTALAVAKNVKLGTITSSPGPTPSANSASKIASLPEAQPTACSAPQYSAIAASNRAHAGPCTNAPESQTSAIAASTSPLQLRVLAVHIEHGNRDRWGDAFTASWFNPQRGNDLRAAEVSAIPRTGQPQADGVLATDSRPPNNHGSRHLAADIVHARADSRSLALPRHHLSNRSYPCRPQSPALEQSPFSR